MASNFYSFSFRDCDFIFGALELAGFEEGDDSVTIAMAKEQWVRKVGAKGDVVRTQTNDNSADITINLLQTSADNAALTAIYNLDRESGLGVLPFISRNKESGETYVCNNAWIVQMPDIIRGQGPNVMSWLLHTDFVTHVII